LQTQLFFTIVLAGCIQFVMPALLNRFLQEIGEIWEELEKMEK
jgi:hypothetical protein